jgi:hypothetical protein
VTLILIAVVALAAVAALTYIAMRSQLAPGPRLAGKTLVVHTKRPDDQSIKGICVAQYADRWELKDALYLHASGPVDAGGLVGVPVINISSYQEIEDAEFAQAKPTLAAVGD